ncbi:uncharacterized protein LOC118205936 isoform X2 [Stegodyphus dumicola]|uniref:uncharacterized protein LOC118205936 isoform X2 n=1 Tax=Stegodyphus dumicola TaxID=202533 RepID=UPI0015B15E7D|nr:uncharacterized protein LOC118205936 isoform X2 [Stegodyphus dumicola]
MAYMGSSLKNAVTAAGCSVQQASAVSFSDCYPLYCASVSGKGSLKNDSTNFDISQPKLCTTKDDFYSDFASSYVLQQKNISMTRKSTSCSSGLSFFHFNKFCLLKDHVESSEINCQVRKNKSMCPILTGGGSEIDCNAPSLYPRKCDICKKNYKTKNSFNNHKKNCKEKLETENFKLSITSPQSNILINIDNVLSAKKLETKECISDKIEMAYLRKCEICLKTYKSKNSFYNHKKKKKKKKCSNKQVPDLKQNFSSVYPRKCLNCNKCYPCKLSFFKHKKFCTEVNKLYVCFIPDCHKSFTYVLNFNKHLADEHNLNNLKEYSFETMSYFQDWLELEGTSTFTSFRKFSKVTKNSKTYHYYCCQFTTQGYSDFEKKKTSRKNEKGTVSKSVCCPVRIWACEEMNKISVFYFPKHNHEQKFENCKYQPLKQSTRCLIKANLRLSVPPQKIRDILQDGSGNRENRNNFPVKESFVSRKTISAYSRYLNNSLRPSSDAVSVNSIIETLKCEAYNPVLLYKPQNNSTLYGPTDLDNLPNHKVSFALGLQTREQKEMMIKGCTEILCIDSTHKTNQYDFYLLNLIVPDEFGCGYPVAHFITNFLDADTLYCLFNSLKCRVPNLYVNCVMTDDDKVTYPAFSKVFGQDVKHLLCSWHVRQSWFRQLNSKVVDKEVRQKMLGELTKILHERNQITFHDQIIFFIFQ